MENSNKKEKKGPILQKSQKKIPNPELFDNLYIDAYKKQ